MNYPLISEYVEAIRSAEDNLKELSYLRPVLGDDGLPVMTSGNFAVVFKMKDEQSGNLYALKCFTKEQEGRADAYREIAKELKDVSSPYLVSIQYWEKELFVDSNQVAETEFPVLLMDWVEGLTLDKYIEENILNKNELEKLTYAFYKLGIWLISQPFAHGDLKPENIVVKEKGEIVLVDYDGMFVPKMKGFLAREIGSEDFRSPYRTMQDFDKNIDDFSIISILLSLCMIHTNPSLMSRLGAKDRLLFSKEDYRNIENSRVYKAIPKTIIDGTNYKLLLKEACNNLSFSFSNNKYVLTRLLCPTKNRRTIPIKKTNSKDKERRSKDSNINKEQSFDHRNNLANYLLSGNSISQLKGSELDDLQKLACTFSKDNFSGDNNNQDKWVKLFQGVVYLIVSPIVICVLLSDNGKGDPVYFVCAFIVVIIGVYFLLHELAHF